MEKWEKDMATELEKAVVLLEHKKVDAQIRFMDDKNNNGSR